MSPPDDSLPGTGWRAGSPVMTPVEGGGPWSGSRVVTRRLRAVLVAAREAAVTPAIAAVPGGEAGMPAEEVLAVVDWLEARGAVHVITGGWAVDALVGRATRPHRDLDVIVEAGACDGLARWLRGRGYEVVVDWLPIRVELRRGRCGVDLHPMEVDGRGDGVQAGFGTQVFEHRAADRTRGRIGGRRVVVATAARLMELHRGYEPRPEDLHDIALLRRLLQSDEPAGGDGEPAG